MGVTEKSIQAMQGLPFDNLIGGPLNACVRAQADAAQTTLRFIQEVGLNTVTENGKESKEAVYVYFTFVQAGRKAIMSVPLLTIVPIPYICINTIDINFKATITGVESSSYTNELSTESSYEKNTSQKKWWSGKTTNMKTSISSKRDSKSTRDSSFSIESTIDVSVHASQDSMPAGMAKVLEMLGSAMDLVDPNGELTVNDTEFFVEKGKKAVIVAQYKTPEGVFTTEGITCGGQAGSVNKSAGTVTFEVGKGDYEVKAGDSTVKVKVQEIQQAAAATTNTGNGGK
jgi:hypothetical protein